MLQWLAELRQEIWESLPAPLQTVLRVLRWLSGPTLFMGGFLWDALTLGRIDSASDNAILFVYLVALGVSLVLDHRAAAGRLPAVLMRLKGWYRLAVHFFFGGLFSAYVVYYLQSASTGRTLVFLGLLALLLVVNEFLQTWMRTEALRLVLFLLCAFSFFLFWIPVATGWLDRGVWLLAALAAVVATALVRLAIDVRPTTVPGTVFRLVGQVDHHLAPVLARVTDSPMPSFELPADPDSEEAAEPSEEAEPALDPPGTLPVQRIRVAMARVYGSLKPTLHYAANSLMWGATLAVLAVMEVAGMIPPVPISVLDTGVYHEVTHTGRGAQLTWEAPPGWRPLDRDDSRWRLREGDRVCFFAPVYSPRGTHPRLYHRWERWDAERGAWEWTGDRGTWIQASGGKQAGSPHHTCKRQSLRPGPWRVTVETEDGRVVARHAFSMVAGPHPEPTLRTRSWP